MGSRHVSVVNDGAILDIPMPNYFINKVLVGIYQLLKFGSNLIILLLNILLIIGNNPIFRFFANILHIITFPIRLIHNIIMFPIRILLSPVRFIFWVLFRCVPRIVQRLLDFLSLLLKPRSLRLLPKLPAVRFDV